MPFGNDQFWMILAILFARWEELLSDKKERYYHEVPLEWAKHSQKKYRKCDCPRSVPQKDLEENKSSSN